MILDSFWFMVIKNTTLHFISGGLLGLLSWSVMRKISKKDFFSFVFAIWFVIATHLLIDYLGWF